ncbi:MAG: hypothetical protein CHACPFDD_02439 [Phycisphaerae bacterium]|nr:hypothetical protein [Phycisphaerae bacterium]
MTAKDALKNNIKFGKMITDAYLSDLSDAELFIRPAPGLNHVAWQLGHLISSAANLIAAAGGKPPALPPDFAACYTKETTTSDDPKKFHRKSDYLALLEAARTATCAAIDATPDADFAKPAPPEMRSYAPTVGDIFTLIGMHDTMHAGQWVALRRKLGKPVLI